MSSAYNRNYRLIDWSKDIEPSRKPRIAPALSSLPCPMLISDTMDPTEHVDGNFYTSKSGYRKVTKARGLVEVGNDPARFRTPARPDRDKGIDEAIDKALARTGA